MYFCLNCGQNFERPEKVIEKHNLDSAPYEEYKVCPCCKSQEFNLVIPSHCKCCGRKLLKNQKEFCSETCREINAILRRSEKRRRNLDYNSDINIVLREVESFNKLHKTRLSYGKYVSAEQIRKEKEKCKKKTKNT